MISLSKKQCQIKMLLGSFFESNLPQDILSQVDLSTIKQEKHTTGQIFQWVAFYLACNRREIFLLTSQQYRIFWKNYSEEI